MQEHTTVQPGSTAKPFTDSPITGRIVPKEKGIEIQSDPFELHPGIYWKDSAKPAEQPIYIKDCVVRLLTNGERDLLAMRDSVTDMDRLFTSLSIVRLGPVTDKNTIADMVRVMLPMDSMRIGRAIKELRKQFSDPSLDEGQQAAQNQCPRCRAPLAVDLVIVEQE